MGRSIRKSAAGGFFLGLCFLALSTFMSYRAINSLVESAEWVAHTHLVKEAIDEFTSELKDLETGQRGYLITGLDSYLEPFKKAEDLVDSTLERLKRLTSYNSAELERVKKLAELKEKKIEEMKRIILLRRTQGLKSATEAVLMGVGKDLMDRFRSIAAEMTAEEDRLLSVRKGQIAEATLISERIIFIGSGVAIVFLMLAAIAIDFTERNRRLINEKLESKNRTRAGLIRLSEKLAGDQSIPILAQSTVEVLASFLECQVAALYLANEKGSLKWAGGFGCRFDSAAKEFKLGEGLIGQVAVQKAPLSVSGVPSHYLKVKSALGDSPPQFIHVFPFLHEGKVKGVIELGSLHPFPEGYVEFLDLTLEIISMAFQSAENRFKVNELLEEAQSQSEELQAQQEELKATNEELEEQRTELEERTQRLEETNREIQKAQVEIEEKSAELERASKYKSEFLANMSHELRTPLNAILLLSKTLETQKENVSPDEREIYQTIYSSGSDLLNLINDILDLSRVEAGKLDIKVTEVKTRDLAESMESFFRSQMKQKGLTFEVYISEKYPETFHTDSFRLEQILKNFLSNSLKFTEHGKISLSFDRADPRFKSRKKNLVPALKPESTLAISVKDTGVGIPKEKLERVFEAFEQVDSTSSRKFGGAGLGLAIATKLSELLGGEIQVESELGKGSRFTVFLPESQGLPQFIETATPAKKVLVVEDKKVERDSLLKLLSSIEVKPIGVESGNEALVKLRGEAFDCMILDLKLPDMSGFDLLMEMEKDLTFVKPPVFIHTCRDLSKEEIEKLNQVSASIVVKGVQSEERLLDELTQLFDRMKKGTQTGNLAGKQANSIEAVFKDKKLLIVDDDMRNVFALRAFLFKKGFEIEVGKNGKEALEKLDGRPDTDLILMDIMMPEMNGYEAMRRIRSQKRFERLPIIALTAKAMSADREECLQAGANDYLSKPIDLDRLLSILRVWLTR